MMGAARGNFNRQNAQVARGEDQLAIDKGQKRNLQGRYITGRTEPSAATNSVDGETDKKRGRMSLPLRYNSTTGEAWNLVAKT